MNAVIKVIEPSGILDNVGADQIRQAISDTVNGGGRTVLIDLRHITFIDSSGLAGLAIAMKALRAVGGRLCFCSVGEQPKMLFELTGMEAVFEMFPNRNEFDKTVKLER